MLGEVAHSNVFVECAGGVEKVRLHNFGATVVKNMINHLAGLYVIMGV